MKLKKLDSYILGEFLAPLALIVFGLAALVWLTQLIDTMPSQRNNWNAPYTLIFIHHLFQFPFLVTQVIPVGIMLATLISLGNLARSCELTALRAGGISAWRIAVPIIIVAFAGSVVLIFLSETVVPWASEKSRYVQRALIEKRSMLYDTPYRSNMAQSISGNRQIFTKYYDAPTGTFIKVAVFTRENSNIMQRIDAERANWDKSTRTWTFTNGMEHTFNEEGRVHTSRKFTKWPLQMEETPDDFMIDTDRRDEDLVKISIVDLTAIIERLKASGADFRQELTCLHLRISYPLSCFVLALLGVSIPFLFPSGSRNMAGAALGALIAITTGISYLVFVQVGLSLGKGGIMPPPLAAWIANIVFLGVGSLTLWKVNR